MNFFEKEMRSLFECTNIIQEAKFSGKTMLGKLDDDLRVKMEFVSRGVAGCYPTLQMSIINRTQGLVDKTDFYFSDVDRLAHMDLRRNLTPAILSYEGIAYQRMAPGVFTTQELQYVQEHLRILSGFYGILRPFDGVTPYRLEMQAKLRVDGKKDLYTYWGNTLAQELLQETDCIVNLASKEYSVCVFKYLNADVKFVTCIFGEEKNGKIIEKGTLCKMARGEMVRFMAQNQITNPEDMKAFDLLDFHYVPQYSDERNYVFLRSSKPPPIPVLPPWARETPSATTACCSTPIRNSQGHSAT